MTVFPLGLLEQFVQIGNAGPSGVDAGDLVSKSDKHSKGLRWIVTRIKPRKVKRGWIWRVFLEAIT